MAKKQKAVPYLKSRVNLAAKPKSVSKSKIFFDFESGFSKRKLPKSRDFEFVYHSFPLGFQGVNLIAHEVVARGFQVIHDRPEAVKFMAEWMDNVNFQEKLFDGIVNTLVFGNGYWEVVFEEEGETVDELIVMDPMLVDFKKDEQNRIIFDMDTGVPKGYIQKTGTFKKEDDIQFSQEEIAHFAFFKLRGHHAGTSLFASVMRSIAHAMNTERSVAEAIFRHGFAQYNITVGKEGTIVTQGQIDEVTSQVKDLQVTNEYVHSDDIQVEVLEAKNTRSYDKYADSFISNIISGMGIPEPLLLGSGESSNKATADVQSRHFRSMIESIQIKLKSVIEDKVFKKIAELQGWTEFPRIEWNEVLDEIESAKVARVASLFEQGIIGRGEAREQIGLPPQTDFSDFKIINPLPPSINFPTAAPQPGQQPGQAPGQRPLPERTGPKPKEAPIPPERSVRPPFNRKQPSERGRAGLKDNPELADLKSHFAENLNHYFDSLRSQTLNKIISLNELAHKSSGKKKKKTNAKIVPMDRVSKELTYSTEELGSLIYNYMKDSTKIGMDSSGAIVDGELALLSDDDRNYLTEFVDVLAKKELDELFNKVKWEVLNSFAKNEALDIVSEKINKEFHRFTSFGLEEGKTARAELIAVSEANRAFNNGLLMGLSKLVTDFVARKGSDCDSCKHCGDKKFDKVALADARGLFPLHPGCECSWVAFS